MVRGGRFHLMFLFLEALVQSLTPSGGEINYLLQGFWILNVGQLLLNGLPKPIIKGVNECQLIPLDGGS